jgi:hypothetical protein
MNDPACIKCAKLEKRVAELEAENARLLKAIHRESEQWDKRAPHSGK